MSKQSGTDLRGVALRQEQVDGADDVGAARLADGQRLHPPLDVAAQVGIKVKLESSLSNFSFRHLVPGAFNVGLIGSTCIAIP
jgi:hypothetical protein